MIIPDDVNTTETNLPVKMVRANLDNVPEFALPTGFALRWYQPGDEQHWLRIHLAADRLNQITPELFPKEFGLDVERGLQAASTNEVPNGLKAALHELMQRQCYLVAPTSEIIGTGTAWFNDSFEGQSWGRVHWMAILPEFQGRSLGKSLLSNVCLRLRELGHQHAYLSTSTARVAAIRLYLNFGFQPLIRTEADERAWAELSPSPKR